MVIPVRCSKTSAVSLSFDLEAALSVKCYPTKNIS